MRGLSLAMKECMNSSSVCIFAIHSVGSLAVAGVDPCWSTLAFHRSVLPVALGRVQSTLAGVRVFRLWDLM